MNTWIVLLRGINFGGRNRLLMKDLSKLLANIGCQNIRTYIQSGNVILQSNETAALKLAANIQKAIATQCGFSPHVLALTKKAYISAIASNPFRTEALENTGKTLHVFFLLQAPQNVPTQKIKDCTHASEKWHLTKNAFYLYTPDGFHRSKIAARLEKLLNVSATARNWRTVSRIAALLNEDV